MPISLAVLIVPFCLWKNSAKSADGSHLTNVSDEEMQEHYDNFFEDVFVEAEDKYVIGHFVNGLWFVITILSMTFF